MRVAIIMGSTSDLSKIEPAVTILKEYGVAVDVRCLSAHRAHNRVQPTKQNKLQTLVTFFKSILSSPQIIIP